MVWFSLFIFLAFSLYNGRKQEQYICSLPIKLLTIRNFIFFLVDLWNKNTITANTKPSTSRCSPLIICNSYFSSSITIPFSASSRLNTTTLKISTLFYHSPGSGTSSTIMSTKQIGPSTCPSIQKLSFVVWNNSSQHIFLSTVHQDSTFFLTHATDCFSD